MLKYFKKESDKKIKIIHADDHTLFRSGVRNALKTREDIEFIGEAGNGQELLDLLELIIPDIIILNMTMPVMNGLEALPKLREKYPDLKVIVLSMHTDPQIITKMMRLGANSYLTKNVSADTIYEAIQCVYQYKYYYSEAIKSAFLR